MSDRPPQPARWIRLHALLGGIAVALLLGWLVARAGVSTPFKDEFEFWPVYAAALHGEFPLGEILAPHNGHPYVTVKPLLWLSAYAAVPLTVWMFGSVLILALAARAAGLRVQGAGWRGWLVGAAVVATVGTPRQWENLYWSMQLAFPLCILLLLLAMWRLERYESARRKRDGIAAVLYALLALLSHGAGPFVFGWTTLMLAWLDRRSRRGVGWLLALGAGIAIYLGLQAIAKGRPGLSGGFPLLREPFAFAEHFLVMLANGIWVFSDGGRDAATLGLGVVLLLLCAWCLLRALRTGTRDHVAAGVFVFLFATALAITHSRLNLRIVQPDAPRYVTLAAPAVAMALLVLQRIPVRAARVATAMLAAGLLLSAGAEFWQEWKRTPYRHVLLTRNHEALCAGATTGLTCEPELSHPDLLVVRAAFCCVAVSPARPLTAATLDWTRIGPVTSGGEPRIPVGGLLPLVVVPGPARMLSIRGSTRGATQLRILHGERELCAQRVDGEFELQVPLPEPAGSIALELRIEAVQELQNWEPVCEFREIRI